jgi:hypothetical protein
MGKNGLKSMCLVAFQASTKDRYRRLFCDENALKSSKSRAGLLFRTLIQYF